MDESNQILFVIIFYHEDFQFSIQTYGPSFPNGNPLPNAHVSPRL